MLGRSPDFAADVSADAISLLIDAIFIRLLLSVARLSPSGRVITLLSSARQWLEWKIASIKRKKCMRSLALCIKFRAVTFNVLPIEIPFTANQKRLNLKYFFGLALMSFVSSLMSAIVFSRSPASFSSAIKSPAIPLPASIFSKIDDSC